MIYLFFMVLFSFISLMFIRKYILICLLSLEFIVISLLIFFIFFGSIFFSSFYFYILLMTFFVCDGALGLSLLVYLIRCHGNNFLSSMFLW
uniref:NADH dehydrogenase subunit 4L n=1 Tax=Krisna rufimarginata TaxID=1962558 RepID=A0A6C0MDW6_9HEMI|nr:NADH dehydrogenase subunit 4L [Krisna rufimarginata]QHV34368.1 NADH dehydrogenase subunit 4L [Krisna rufimarginata]